jgi:hypothetical protein
MFSSLSSTEAPGHRGVSQSTVFGGTLQNAPACLDRPVSKLFATIMADVAKEILRVDAEKWPLFV